MGISAIGSKYMVDSPNIEFEILIDELFVNINTTEDLEPIHNKKLLSLVNDFEDGKWRYNKFQSFVWDNITETSLSYKERESVINKSHTSLVNAAKNLRLTDSENDIGKGSELAEIVLYGIMKHYYNALPVVPKIFYKQNSQDNAKGADSVHIVIENGNDFSLWFGEAKFYNSFENSKFYNLITSIENSLQTDKLKKENSIITNLSDLELLIDDDDLKCNILDALSPKNSIDSIKPKLHIPILVLHECEITKDATDFTDDYKDKIIEHHKDRANGYFKKQIEKLHELHRYSEIKFHLILFPVPIKSQIVDRFVSNVEHYKME